MKLRSILFLAFSGIAVIPVVSLAAWIYVFAVDREIDKVKESHLLLAKNVGAALDRYALDARSLFEHVAFHAVRDIPMAGTKEIMIDLDFVHLCVADAKTGTVVNEVVPETLPCPAVVPKQRLRRFLDVARADEVTFSPVLPNPLNRPTIYLLKRDGDKIVIGAISTNYIVDQGKVISFGDRGHAAIVDHAGRLIAHPLPAWRESMKDISRLTPVKKMLARETGTIKFFSPALKADMVAGYTFVPTTGWGVMIPQPFAELKKDAGLVRLWASRRPPVEQKFRHGPWVGDQQGIDGTSRWLLDPRQRDRRGNHGRTTFSGGEDDPILTRNEFRDGSGPAYRPDLT